MIGSDYFSSTRTAAPSLLLTENDALALRPAPDAVTTYADDATGQPIPLTPGRTWVELVPIGGASQTG